MLAEWIVEPGENIHEGRDRVILFGYSAKLAAALELHDINDLPKAWSVVPARCEALSDLHNRL